MLSSRANCSTQSPPPLWDCRRKWSCYPIKTNWKHHTDAFRINCMVFTSCLPVISHLHDNEVRCKWLLPDFGFSVLAPFPWTQWRAPTLQFREKCLLFEIFSASSKSGFSNRSCATQGCFLFSSYFWFKQTVLLIWQQHYKTTIIYGRATYRYCLRCKKGYEKTLLLETNASHYHYVSIE